MRSRIALVITLLFAFATSTWTISAQGLWQHGVLNLIVLAMLVALIQAHRSPQPWRWHLAAGLACGLLPGIRQTGLLFAAVALLYRLWRDRGRSAWFCLGWISAIPALWWNWHYFGNALTGAYRDATYLYQWDHFSTSLPGLLLSPSRGLLIFTPIALFAVPGFWQLLKQLKRQQLTHTELTLKSSIDWLLAGIWIAGCGVLLTYSFFGQWHGGYCYGPRFMTDVAPIVCLMLGYYLDALRQAWPQQKRLAGLLFGLAASFSMLTQVAGIAINPTVDWNTIPYSFGYPADLPRAWDWQDSQLMRSFHGMQHHSYAKMLNTEKYVTQFRGRILQVTDFQDQAITPPGRLDRAVPYQFLKIQIQNQGHHRWYGYQTGIGIGETMVQGDLYNAQNQRISTTIFYLSSTCLPGETCSAIGQLFTPTPPGNYSLKLQLALVGIGPQPNRNPPYRLTLAVP
ncbi:MAG: hypothetical protein HC805_00165 [Alkalinema sp. RL_2_19]|nr:hypothetical protein [Alkalinema sp. RL_2_19]